MTSVEEHNVAAGKPAFQAALLWAGRLSYLLGLIWVAFGVASLLRAAQGASAPTVMDWMLAGLMVGNAGALTLVGWGIARGARWAWYAGVAWLAANILLTITDEFGFFDAATLLLDGILLGLLIRIRSLGAI